MVARTVDRILGSVTRSTVAAGVEDERGIRILASTGTEQPGEGGEREGEQLWLRNPGKPDPHALDAS
jgi:hypothetical protein